MRKVFNQELYEIDSHTWSDDWKFFSIYAKSSFILVIMLAGFAFGEAEPRKSLAEITAEHTLTGSQTSIVRTLDDKKYPYLVASDYFGNYCKL